MTRSVRRLITGTAVAGCLLGVAGCHTTPGAAAIVGRQTIGTDQLTTAVNQALSNPVLAAQHPSRATVARSVLTQLIEGRLLDDIARSEGVSVSPAQVNQQINTLAAQSGGMAALQQAAEQQGVAPADLHEAIRLNLLSTLVKNYLQRGQTILVVHSAHILVSSQALATSLLARVKAHPSSFASLAKRYSIDTGTKNNGGDLGTTTPGTYVAPFAKALEDNPAGAYVLVHSQFGWHVVHIISKTSVPLSSAPPSVQSDASQAGNQLLDTALVREAKRLGVWVNPRFGRWDAATVSVVAPANRLSSPAP